MNTVIGWPGGCQLLWEGDEGQGGGIWRVSCLWKIWSAQVCEEILSTRYSVDRVRCELRDPKKGVVGSYYCHISQREIKKVIVLA